jgi:small-conductance mechanosensitive channel
LKQRTMEAAQTPAERFIARMELELAQSRSSQSGLDTFLVRIKQDVVEQQKRLASEKEELDNLREYMKLSGGSSRAADRIKLTLQQIKLRRRLLRHLLRGDRAGTIAAYQARRFEVEDALFHLRESWTQDRQQVLVSLPQQKQAALVSQTDKLLDPYRAALRKERALVGEAVRAGQQLQNLYFERLENMDELERFIRSTAFWLRDGKPIGPGTPQEVDREFRRLAYGDRGVFSRSMLDRLALAVRSPVAVALGILLFPVAPLGLFLARRRLRCFVARRNEGALDDDASRRSRIAAVIVAVANSALVPAYLLLVAKTVRWADVPKGSALLAGVLEYAAYPLFLWFVARAMFRERGLAQAQFGMPPEAARCLQRFLRLALLAAMVFLPWWRTLSRPPFELLWLPRIAYTLFELALAAAVILLIRPRSPLLRQWVLVDPEGLIARQWSVLSVLAIAAILFVLALDVTGYRYAASALGRSFLLSLATLVLLPPLYRSLMRGIQSVARWRQRATATVAPGEEPESNEVVRLRLQRFVQMAFIVLALFMLANWWGLDQQAFKTLDDIQIYSARGTGDTEEYVTAADVVRCVLFLVGTFWLLRSLPGIYEFTLFPRLRIDEGLKYAILTISRYSIFAIGMILALSEIHLDLGRLSWLMAAVGVGLGFGLQEIVSNFVSGIILLVERPIQVGDLVTIGTMSGTVKRINIRATTILNFDRQEVVVPNRSLITKDVTNWTRGDTTMRLVISIGAAYGSDVDQVTEVLNRIAQDDSDVLEDPAPSVVFMQHGESSLDFNLRVFIPSPAIMMVVRDRLNKAINREFASLGIEIPFPQRDLHIKSSAVPVEQVGTDQPHGSG